MKKMRYPIRIRQEIAEYAAVPYMVSLPYAMCFSICIVTRTSGIKNDSLLTVFLRVFLRLFRFSIEKKSIFTRSFIVCKETVMVPKTLVGTGMRLFQNRYSP